MREYCLIDPGMGVKESEIEKKIKRDGKRQVLTREKKELQKEMTFGQVFV